MERSEAPLAPQWLKSSGNSGNNSTWSAANHRRAPSLPQSEKDAYSNFRRNASKNRSYFTSGRSQHASDKRTYTNDVNDKKVFALGNCKQHNHSDSLDSVFLFSSEKDASKQSHPVILRKSGETWRRKVPSNLNNDDKSNNRKDDHLVACGTADTVNKTSFEHEFPSLVSEDEQGVCERGTGLSTISQTFTVGNLADSGNNSLVSTLVRAPITDGSSSRAVALASSSSSTSSVPTASSITGRNMAETLAQVPARLHTPSQLTVETQKLEELAIKQSQQLVPLTPSALRSPVVSPTKKSKLKIGQQQQPFLRAANLSPGSHTKSDTPKTNLVSLSVMGASKEFGGSSSSAKATLIANKSTVMNGTNCIAQIPLIPGPVPLKKPNNLESTAQMTLGRRLTSQAQSRNDFFKNLSRKTSTSTSSNLPLASTNTMPSELDNCQTPQVVTASVSPNCVHVASLGASVPNSTNENSSSIISQENEFCADENAEKKSRTNSVLYPDEKEAAFLRSLGWEENTEDDGGLTEEEINEFWDKVTSLLKGLKQEEIVAYCNKHLRMKLKPLSGILDKLLPRMMLVQLNSNERSCNGGSPQLSPSA